MGKNFPLITTLKEKPSCTEATIRLIEKSFKYEAPHSFVEDFAPLISPHNLHNCFILINENEDVIAHIGASERKLQINNNFFSICLLGGIAVAEESRGQGHFQELMRHVLTEKKDTTTFFLLWSDLEKLYNKFGFYLCGNQFELPLANKKSSFTSTKYHLLSDTDKKQIQSLYQNSFAKNYLTIHREHKNWEAIATIRSADLYLKKKDDQITDYFFINKGQDLQGIIYEYGSSNDFKEFIANTSSYGKVWTPGPITEADHLQFQFFLCPGDVEMFSSFISEMTNQKIMIRDINLMKQEVYFDFNSETLALEIQDFLRGMFGPGVFEEISENLRPIFISGLDSI